MGLLATALFVTLFAFGSQMIGWTDPENHVQMTLFLSFVLGVLTGYRARG